MVDYKTGTKVRNATAGSGAGRATKNRDDGRSHFSGGRCKVGGKTKFVCVDGPEFDGHQVDFDNMMKRLKAYKQQEDHAREQCKLELEMAKLNQPQQGAKCTS